MTALDSDMRKFYNKLECNHDAIMVADFTDCSEYRVYEFQLPKNWLDYNLYIRVNNDVQSPNKIQLGTINGQSICVLSQRYRHSSKKKNKKITPNLNCFGVQLTPTSILNRLKTEGNKVWCYSNEVEPHFKYIDKKHIYYYETTNKFIVYTTDDPTKPVEIRCSTMNEITIYHDFVKTAVWKPVIGNVVMKLCVDGIELYKIGDLVVDIQIVNGMIVHQPLSTKAIVVCELRNEKYVKPNINKVNIIGYPLTIPYVSAVNC
jgi:hypothetical protein